MGTGQATMVGKEAPALALSDTEGARHSLPAPRETSASVVVWTCNHCPYALAWHDRLVEAARDYAERGVRFFAVNSNDPERYPRDSLEAMRERVRAEDWPFPYLHDPDQEAARAWNAQVTPHLYVLDADLRVRYEGAPDADHMNPDRNAEWLRAALDAVLAAMSRSLPPPSPWAARSSGRRKRPPGLIAVSRHELAGPGTTRRTDRRNLRFCARNRLVDGVVSGVRDATIIARPTGA